MALKETIKIVLLADTHLGLDLPVKPRVERRRRGWDLLDNYQRVLDYAAREPVDLVVHGGDLFNRSQVPAPIVSRVYEPLLKLADTGMPIVVIPGNHERSKLPDPMLLAHANIYVFDEPKTVYLTLQGYQVALAGFPFVRHGIRDQLPAALDLTGYRDQPADLRLLCIHQSVQGAQVGPVDYTFRYGPDVIPLVAFPDDLHLVLAGHIHRRQVLNRGDLQVVYPGSIERTSFAEKGEPKGYYRIDFEFDPGRDEWRYELDFRPLPVRPMHDIILDGAGHPEPELLADLENRLLTLEPDAVVRLRYHDQEAQRRWRFLTARTLREITPESMNIQFGSRPVKVKPGLARRT